jgi:hypothetical protein
MLWRKKKAEVARDDQSIVQKVSIEDWSEDEKHDFYSAVSDYSQLDIYTGFVEHGYAMDTVATPACCPRCQAATQQQYANFIYATQRAPRVMFAPAGYFCTVCPAVVIDEALIRQGVRRPFTYQGVLGIDHQDKTRPDLFKTWNGARTLYIFDEDHNPIGLTTTAGLPSKGATRSKRQSDRRKQMAKVSRKQNRRKR